jgi:hypothetical protein
MVGMMYLHLFDESALSIVDSVGNNLYLALIDDEVIGGGIGVDFDIWYGKVYLICSRSRIYRNDIAMFID